MRDKRERSWFWVDNALVDRTDLNLYEKMLYICLARHTGTKEYCFPGLETLCKELGVKDKRTIVKYIRALEDKKLIEIERAKGKSNKYYLNNVEVDTSNVPTCNVPTPNVPAFDEVVTSDVGRVVTSDATSSSDMRCTSKKTNIKKTNIKRTTTEEDIENKIEKNSSSSFSMIKNLLVEHGISTGTITNIMSLVQEKNISLERVVTVLEFSTSKQWGEGAIFKALKENWAFSKENLNIEDTGKIERKLKSVYEYYKAGIDEKCYSHKSAQLNFSNECKKYKDSELFKKYYELLGGI